MPEGYLQPVVAEAIFDGSKFGPEVAKAVAASDKLAAALDKTGIAAAKSEVAISQAAVRAASAQERATAAATRAAKAQADADDAARRAAAGEITLAEAADKATAATEAAAVAADLQTRAAIAAQRAVIAQAEANALLSREALGSVAAVDATAAASVGMATKVGAATTEMAASAGFLGRGLSMLRDNWVLAAAVVGFESLKMSSNFNKAMEYVHTQAGAPQAEVDKLKASVLALGPATGQGPEKLAEGLYHVESVGYRGSDAMGVLKLGAEEASISGAKLDDTVYSLTSTMKTFGDSGVAGATKDMSLLNAIVGQGDMRFQDLNAAIQTGILSTGQTFGVSLQSMGAALAYLTDRGEKADVSSTRLAMGITLLAAPSSKASSYLHDLGLSSDQVTAGTAAMAMALEKSGLSTTVLADDLRKPDGIKVALQDLVDHLHKAGLTANESAALIAKIFGGARTGKAMMALVENLDGVEQKFIGIGKQASQFGEDFAATQNTLNYKWHAFVATLEADGIRLGNFLAPVATGALSVFGHLGQLLAPLGSSISDVWHETQHLGSELEPLAKLVVAAFGVAVVATVDALGFALRDVVSPAIHGVADAFGFLDHNKAVVAGLATVIGVALVPKLVAMGIALAGDAAASAAFVAVNLAGAIKSAAGAVVGFVAANPELAGMAVLLGGIATVFELVSRDTRTFTVDTQALTAAVKDQLTTLDSKKLAGTFLDDLSKWKPTSGSVDALTYMQKYGVAAGQLTADLARPENAEGVKAFTDMLTTQTELQTKLVSAGSPSRGGGGVYKSMGYDIAALGKYINSTNPAVAEMARLFVNLEKDHSVDNKTVVDLAKHLGALNAQTINLRIQQGALLKQQKEQQAAYDPGLLRQQATDTKNLAAVQKLLVLDDKNIAAGQKKYDDATKAIGQTIAQQFPIFQKYRDELKSNAQALDDNVRSEIQAMADEQKNVTTLVNAGFSTTAIAALAAQGPQYVAAATKGTMGQLKSLAGDINSYYKTLGSSVEQQGIATGNQAVISHVIGIAQKEQDLKTEQQLVFVKNFDSIAQQLGILAGTAGSDMPNLIAQGVRKNTGVFINSLASGFTGPQQQTVRELEQLALSGGGQVVTNLASAIATGTPLVVSKAEKLKLDTNAQIQAILKEWNIKVVVDDQATATLQQIRDYANKLIDLGAGTPALIAQAASGGGHGTSASANGNVFESHTAQIAKGSTRVWAEPETGGEAYIPLARSKRARSLGIWAKTGNLLGVPGFADGGITATSGITINEDAITSRMLGMASGAVQARSFVGSAGGAAQWAPLVSQALAMEGLPASLLGRVMAQMNLESGGNPNAINNTDSNAAIGQNSRGLLQTIPSTFAAYHWPGTSDDIYDPLANIAAAINYGAHRYGAATLGMGFGHGYADGGIVGATPGARNPVPKAESAYLRALASAAKKQTAESAYLSVLQASGFLHSIAHLGQETLDENSRAAWMNSAFASGRTTAANVPGVQAAAASATMRARQMTAYFNAQKAGLIATEHSRTATPAARRAAGALYSTLASDAWHMTEDARQETALAAAMRRRYAGPEARQLVPGRPSQDYSYLASLHGNQGTTSGPTHAYVTVVAQMDSQVAYQATQKVALRTGQRGLTNGLTPSR